MNEWYEKEVQSTLCKLVHWHEISYSLIKLNHQFEVSYNLLFCSMNGKIYLNEDLFVQQHEHRKNTNL